MGQLEELFGAMEPGMADEAQQSLNALQQIFAPIWPRLDRAG